MLHAIIETLSPSDDSVVDTEHLFVTRAEYEDRKSQLTSLQELIIIQEQIV